MNFGLDDTVIKSLCDVFCQHANIRQVLVFGSRAKGNYRPGSDIDLALVGDDITFNQRNTILGQILDTGILYGIDLVDYNKKKDTNIGEHIARVGIPLYSAS